LPSNANQLAEILRKNQDSLAEQWLTLLANGASRRQTAAEQRQTASETRTFLAALGEGVQAGDPKNISAPEWTKVRDVLTSLSGARAKAGYTPTETASFVFSLKEPLFVRLREEFANNPQALAQETWTISTLLDAFGLYTTEVAQRAREEIISRQQQELLELSTPVVRLWENVLALPLIGTLDSARTQVVMQNLLEAIVNTRSDIAIIDITGVPTVDTLVAQHLLKTVAAARLMGADCIISGIRPQIAQTIIHLGVDLADVTTKATLADAFALALQRTGLAVTRVTPSVTSSARS
jgi:rsbT co-antagonist protein RsbR